MKTSIVEKLVIAVIAGMLLGFVLDQVFQGERRNYNTLTATWNDSSNSMIDVRSKTLKVKEKTKDLDLEYVADFLALQASFLDEIGYQTIAHIENSSHWEAAGRGFLAGFINPWINRKSIPLLMRERTFKRRANIVDKRYGGIHMGYYLLGMGICFGGTLLLDNGRQNQTEMPTE